MKTLFTLLLLFFCCQSSGQYSRFFLLNEADHLPVNNALVFTPSGKFLAESKPDGTIRIALSESTDSLLIQAIGYHVKYLNFSKFETGDTIFLEPLSLRLKPIEIYDSLPLLRSDANSNLKIDIEKFSRLTYLFGEPDLLKGIQLLPGVNAVMENNSSLFVRGGRAEATAYLVDGAELFSPAHSLGFFSTIHPASVRSVALYRAGIPAEYGGRNSAFLDVGLKSGSFNKTLGTASIGLISSYVDFQSPVLTKDKKSSLFASFRTTYLSHLIKLITKDNQSFNTDFTDAAVKYAQKLNDRTELRIAYYRSVDNFRLSNRAILGLGSATQWANNLGSVALTKSGDRVYQEFQFHLSQYKVETALNDQEFHNSGIFKLDGQYEFRFYDDKKLLTSGGLKLERYKVNPGDYTLLDGFTQELKNVSLEVVDLNVFAPFINLRHRQGNTEFNFHFRSPLYFQEEGIHLVTEPRASVIRRLKNSSISLAYDRLSQNLRMYSANVTPLPYDIWISSLPELPISISNSLSLTYKRDFREKYELSGSVYYRKFSNVSELRPGTSYFTDTNYIANMALGENRSYGMEFLLQKTSGKLTGLLNYTYARSINRIKGINEGAPHPAFHDKPHVFNFVLNYQWKKWDLNASFSASSGRPVTLPIGHAGIITVYSDRNEFRLKAYHRLDLAANYTPRKRKHFQGQWQFSIYNVYNRKNVYSVELNPETGKMVYLTLFPIIPSISYNISFF